MTATKTKSKRTASEKFAEEVEREAREHPPMPVAELERLNQNALGRLMTAMNHLRNVIDMLHGDTEYAFMNCPMPEDYDRYKDIRLNLYNSFEDMWRLVCPMVLDTDLLVGAFPNHR